MKTKRRKALFKELREEAKRINAWEALELIQQAQTAFDCAMDVITVKTFKKQSRKLDRVVARICKILPQSHSTIRLEIERRKYQARKDRAIWEYQVYDDDVDEFGEIESSFCWCADDD